jgi:DNA-binding SARP family transcriptional activator/predicted ATPase
MWHGNKSKALVKLLAIAPSHQVHKEQISAALWPDLESASAGAAFRKALHYARKALGNNTIVVTDAMVALNRAEVMIDLDRFLSQAESALASPDALGIAEAASLCSGELLPSDVYEDWSDGPRRRVSVLHVELLRAGGQIALSSGRLELGVRLVSAALALDPLAEDLHRCLMSLWVALARPAAALEQFQRCQSLLARELDTTPETETQELASWIAQLPKSDGALTALAGPKGKPLPRAQMPSRLRGSASRPFVARSRPLQLLLGSWQAVRSVTPSQLVVVRGEAGIGKTRLMVEVAREVAAAGGGVLWGGCYELEGTVTYGPFVEAFETYLHELAREQVLTLARRYPDLVPLLPSFGQSGVRVEGKGLGDQARLFDAIARFLRELGQAAGAPTLIVIDDLPESDAATVALLHYLLRIEGAHNWLVAATWRESSGAEGGSAARLLGALSRTGQCREIDLLRLAHDDARLLVVAELDGQVTDDLHALIFDLAHGNPFFTTQIARFLADSGQIGCESGRWARNPDSSGCDPMGGRGAPETTTTGVPSSIRTLVDRQLDRLASRAKTDRAKEVVRLASIAGTHFRFPVLSAAAAALPTPVDEMAVIEALEAGVQVGLLEPWSGGFQFPHPLLCTTVRESTSRPRRAVLHRAIAFALEQTSPDQSESLAYHFTEAGVPTKAIEYLERAGDRAFETFDAEAAASCYLTAVELIDGCSPDTGGRGDILLKYARCLVRLGRNREAPARLVDAIEWFERSHDRDKLLLAVGEYALCLHRLGMIDEATSLLARHLRGDDQPTRGSVYARLVQSSLLGVQGRYGEVADLIREARGLAISADDQEMVAEADLLLSAAVAMVDGMTQGREIALRSLPYILKHMGFEAQIRALHRLSWLEMMTGDALAMVKHVETALELAKKIGDCTQVGLETAHLAQACAFAGDLTRARTLIADAVSRLSDGESEYIQAQLLLYVGQIQALEGEWALACGTFREACDRAVKSRDIAVECASAYWWAELELSRGRFRDGLTVLHRALETRASVGEHDDINDRLLQVQRTWGLVGSAPGRVDSELLEVVREAVEFFGQRGYVLYLAAALRVYGGALIAANRQAEGFKTLDRSLTVAEGMSYVWMVPSSLGTLAACHALVGDYAEAAQYRHRLEVVVRELEAPKLLASFESALEGLVPGSSSRIDL